MSPWKQRLFTDRLLFDYYLISSLRETDVFSPFPTFLDESLFQRMTGAAQVLDRLTARIIRSALEHPHDAPVSMEAFPFKKDILGIDLPLAEFFWARFDAFVRPEGTIFFTEFNYDKPCAQREILFSEHLDPSGNPSRGFSLKFREAFKKHLKRFRGRARKHSVAILIDPCHSEEAHLAQLYIDLLRDPSIEFIIAGARNFSVKNQRLFAFNRAVDVILRQFPTEFLYELECFGEILELFTSGKILIVNDPRAIIGQAKSIFATLWEMEKSGDPFLSEEERRTIRETLPYTEIFNPSLAGRLRDERESWVIKSVFGRYSQEVYIGRACSDEEWSALIDRILKSEKLHIAQQFCHARPEGGTAVYGGSYLDVEALVNYGIYLIDGEFSGLCARWTEDYLTEEHSVWFSAVGLRKRSLTIESPPENRNVIWQDINDTVAFAHGYTGGYTGSMEYFSMQALPIGKELLAEIREATESLCPVFLRATELVQEKPDLLCPFLGIDDSLHRLIRLPRTGELTFLGRLDWALTTEGSLKALEFNSETPAGLMESVVLTSLLLKGRREIINPNDGLPAKIRESCARIIEDFSRFRKIETVGLVSLVFYEDWENLTMLHHILKDLPCTFVTGEVSGLEAKEGRLYLYGTPLDALYRYYPLDWFARDAYYNGVIEALEEGTFSINPPSTLICQSKAFFALLWELARQGFFRGEESGIIEKYIPHTELEPGLLQGGYVSKPLLGREGEGISVHYGNFPFPGQEGYVFQEKLDIQSVALKIHTMTGSSYEARYPVLGAYVTGSSFAGLFVRAGARITDRRAVFLPAFTTL
jgi:glutathionylspermidine synthase